MICKKDVVVWFKELESYKRIDTMCTLLSMCLPFELRFLGTCLEELGRRDSQELRGMELRVNNPQDLATDMGACQKGEPTDMKIRRKMALYLALIRACNRTCVTSTEIFRTLNVWGERDFDSMQDPDTLQELLLVYTMAANHPVFTFEQHRRCIEIFECIKRNKLVSDTPTPTPPPPPSTQTQVVHVQMDQSLSESPITTAGSSSHLQHELRQAMPPPSHQEILQQHTLHTMHLPGQHPQLLSCPAPIQVITQGSMPINFPQHQMTVEAMQHINMSNIIPADSNALIAHPSAPWPPRHFAPPPPGPPSMEHPPQSSSPMLSQQSSPSSSRTTSPSRAPSTNALQQGMPQIRNVPQRLGGSSVKNVRRPSAETTPPPMTQMMTNEIILPSAQSMKHVDEIVISSDGSGNQLQKLILNGYTRSGQPARLKAGSYIPPQQQSPVNQHYQAIPAGNYAAGLGYSMQNLTLSEGGGSGAMHMSMDAGMVGMNSNKSTGSDSGSSIGSSGEISPPETPTIMSNATTNPGGHRDQQQPKHHQQVIYKQMSMGRLNGGRGEKVHVTSGAGGGVSTASTIIYAPTATLANPGHQQQQQQQSQFDIILAPGGNAGAANMMQSAALGGGNNNSLGDGTSSVSNMPVASNNNMNTNAGATVLISTSAPTLSTGGNGAGVIGNVITSNAVILQSHQQQASAQQQPQFNATYPYHAAQHLATTTRPPPPLLAHNPAGMPPPPPPGTFRFPLPANGELIYPTAYHPASIAFLTASGASAPGAPPPPVTIRAANTASAVLAANVTSSAQLQQSQPGAALLAVSPYGGSIAPKPVSCYNCGSQTHTGRDCQEASMDDVTRSAIYKLDYSVSSAPTAATNVVTTATTVGTSSSGMTDVSTMTQQQSGAASTLSATSSASSNTK